MKKLLSILLFFTLVIPAYANVYNAVHDSVYPAVYAVDSVPWAQSSTTFDLSSAPTVLTYTRASTQYIFDGSYVLQSAANNIYPIYHDDGFATWPSATNQRTSAQYRNPTEDSTNNTTNTSGQTGIDETSNAYLIEDTDSGATQYIRSNTIIPDDTNPVSYSFFIHKTAGTSNYARIRIYTSGGNVLDESIVLNKSTGSVAEISSDGDYNILDCGEWWLVTLSLTNDGSGNTLVIWYIQPAFNLDGSTSPNGAATGSICVDWMQVILNSKYCPVFPVDGGATLALFDATITNNGLIAASEGTIIIEYQALPEYGSHIDNAVLLSNGDCEIRSESSVSGISFNDGTNDTDGPVGTPSGSTKCGISWTGTTVLVSANGSNTSGTYAGNFGNSTIRIGRDASGEVFSGVIKTITFYPTYTAATALNALTTE